MFCSLTLIQGGAERRRGSRSSPCVCLCLDQHTVFGRGLEVTQDDALHLPGGAHAQAVPPSKLLLCGVVLPVTDGVAAKEPICEIWLGGLMRGEATLWEELVGIWHKTQQREKGEVCDWPSTWLWCCEQWGSPAACPEEDLLVLRTHWIQQNKLSIKMFIIQRTVLCDSALPASLVVIVRMLLAWLVPKLLVANMRRL